MPVYGEISSGGSKAPLILERFDLRCLDASVCATKVVPGSRGSEGRVAGLRVGETDVVMTFEHPVNHVPGEGRFHVRFAADAGDSLAVGQPFKPDWHDPMS